VITWQGSGGSKVSFLDFPNTKTMRFTVTASFTPITDHFNVTNFRFQNFTATTDPISIQESTVNGVFQLTHDDDGKIRIARPPATFSSSADQSFSAGGAPVAMNPITLTESSTVGNGGIWQATGIRIVIPAGLNMTWNPVQTCALSGAAVSSGHIAANPTCVFSGGNKVVRIPVLSDFSAGESVTIGGLQFANFGNDSSGSLTLNLGTSAATSAVHATDPTTKTVLGLPTILSASNQVFTVGDPSTPAANITVTESAGSTKINTVDDIKITIPNSLNMTFDTSVVSVGCSGTAVTSTHMLNPTNGVTYSNGNRTVTIPVNGNFSSAEVVTISGLKYANFSAASGAAALTLEVNAAHAGIEDTDNNTIAIGRPSISSAQEQVFLIAPPGPSPVTMQPLTISDDPANPRIFNGTQIRIVIPAAPPFNMTWAGTATAVTTGGLNTAVTYAGGNKTLIVTAGPGWVPGGSGTVSGLDFSGFAAASSPDNLELWMSSLAGASATNFDDKIIAIGGVPTMSSTANQQFTVGDGPTAAANNTVITDSSSPSLQNGRTIQMIIPAGLAMEYRTSVIPTATPGAGTGTVGAPSFPDVKTLNIPITADFAPGQTLTISGLQFTNFTAGSPLLGLQLRVNLGGPIAATDAFKKTIGAPTISSAANQTFGTLDPATAASVITITDDATTPRIRNGFDIRVRIPAGFNMDFDTTIVPTLAIPPTGPGSGTGTINPTATYPNSKTMLITVLNSFSAGQRVTITGAVFQNFSAASPLDNLELEVNNAGLPIPNAFDDKTIKIGTRPTITSVLTSDVNGNGSLDHLTVTFSEDMNPATTSITKGDGLNIVGYTIALGVPDPFDAKIVVYTLIETGLPDTGAIPVITYSPASGNLTDQNDGLRVIQTTIPGAAIVDGAAPQLTGFQTTDANGNGRIDQIVFTFSENLSPTQADINDWVLIDADGHTNLLAGLTTAEITISGNTLTIALADNTGTTGDPRFRYKSNGTGGQLQDLSGNFVALTTNNHAPVANAGPDQTLPPTRVTLNGTGSFDPDGQNLSYVWAQTGGGGVTLTNPSTATPSFVTVIPDTYVFVLTVSDGLTSTQDTVAITILNVAPTAVALLDQVGTVGSPVRVVATTSSDINGNGDIASYLWTKISGPAVVLSGTTTPAVDFTPGLPGVYVLEVAVTDSLGNVSRSRVTVRVNSATVFVPTANAGPDQVKVLGSTVTLDGRLSSTSGPNPLNYLWSPNFLFVGDETLATPSFTPTGPGLYTFQLTVTDSVTAMDSVPATVNVLVYDPANLPPVAVAHKLTPSGDPLVGDVITLDATGSLDPEGAPLLYAWRQTAGPAAYLTNPAISKPAFTPALSGTYEFELVVYDGFHTSFPSRTRFQVLPAGVTALPVTVSASAANGAPPKLNGHFDLAAGQITLTGTFTPAVGQVSDVFWEQLDGPNVRLQGGIPNLPWYGPVVPFTPPVPGRYVFRVNALDFSHLLLATDTIEVIVDGANIAPTAVAGSSQTGLQAGQTVRLDGSLSTDDTQTFATGLTPYWKQVTGPPVALTNPTSANPTFVPPTAGVYIFELAVNDGALTSSTSVVEIDVDSAAAAPVSGGSGGGGCGLLGLEPLLLIALAAGLARRRSR